MPTTPRPKHPIDHLRLPGGTCDLLVDGVQDLPQETGALAFIYIIIYIYNIYIYKYTIHEATFLNIIYPIINIVRSV